MKLLKVKIGRDQNASRTHYTYPEGYDAQKVKFGPIYESSLPENYQKVVDRGNKDEYCIIGVKSEDVEGFLKSDDIVKITKKETLRLGNIWTRQVERIVDQNRVLQVCAKSALGEPLTQKEKDSLNPEKEEVGINKSKSFEEDLNEYLAVEENE